MYISPCAGPAVLDGECCILSALWSRVIRCGAEHHVVTYIPCLEQEDKGGHFVGHGTLGADCTLVRFGIAACFMSSANSLHVPFICLKKYTPAMHAKDCTYTDSHPRLICS